MPTQSDENHCLHVSIHYKHGVVEGGISKCDPNCIRTLSEFTYKLFQKDVVTSSLNVTMQFVWMHDLSSINSVLKCQMLF